MYERRAEIRPEVHCSILKSALKIKINMKKKELNKKYQVCSELSQDKFRYLHNTAFKLKN